MSRSKYEEDYFGSSRSNSGRGSGRSSPRGSRRESRDVNSSYGDSSPEADISSRRNERPVRRSSIRNYFTDALDDLERNLRKFEEESGALMHDYSSIKSQHQSQSRRINDLMRYFEEARYRIDKINHRGYRGYGSDHGFDSNSGRRSSIHSIDRGDRSGSFRDRHTKSSKRNDDSASDRSDY